MNDKQSSYVGDSRDSPSPTPPTLCFSQQRRIDKKHRDGYHESCRKMSLCGCRRTSTSHCMAAIGVLVLLLAYTTMGSILFMALEGEDDTGKTETAVAASKPRTDLVNADIRSRTVDRLWSITEDLNILYKENWTRLAAQEVQQFQDMLLRSVRATKVQQTGFQPLIKTHRWSYASAFLYSITLITTIGYGGISPRTQWGRVAAILYAFFGIPLVLFYLSTMGDGLSLIMRCMFRKLRTCGTKSNRSDGSGGTNSGTSSNNSSTTGIGTIRGRSNNGSIMDKTYHTTPFTSNTNADKLLKSKQNYDGSYNSRAYDCHYHRHLGGVPISICIMILICYVTLGAALFHRLQSWNVLESLYFCFSSLGTIGFGELEPKGYIAQYVASGYILVGMALVAMCFSLIRSELSAWMYRTNDSHSSDEKLNAMPNVISHVPHHNHMMHQITNSDDVALVTVAVTPKS